MAVSDHGRSIRVIHLFHHIILAETEIVKNLPGNISPTRYLTESRKLKFLTRYKLLPGSLRNEDLNLRRHDLPQRLSSDITSRHSKAIEKLN